MKEKKALYNVLQILIESIIVILTCHNTNLERNSDEKYKPGRASITDRVTFIKRLKIPRRSKKRSLQISLTSPLTSRNDMAVGGTSFHFHPHTRM